MMFDRRHGFRSQPLSYSVIERFAFRARSAMLPNRSLTESIPGLHLFENLNELEILAKAARGERTCCAR